MIFAATLFLSLVLLIVGSLELYEKKYGWATWFLGMFLLGLVNLILNALK